MKNIILKNLHSSLIISNLILCFILSACSSTGDQTEATAVNKSSDTVYETVDNAKTSVAWAGIYQGIFPCSGCEGIATMLKINNDLTYSLRTRKLGKEEIDKKSNGKFIWLDKTHIQLTGDGQSRKFLVGKNFLRLLDSQGKDIPTANPKQYILEKTD